MSVRRPSALAAAVPWLAVGALVGVLALQGTRWELLGPRNDRDLWIAVVLTLAAAIVLRTDWGAGRRWSRDQAALGTLSNSFYEPRREALVEGTAVLGGVVGALYWAATTWLLLALGMRRRAADRGLFDLQVGVIVGVISGAMVGAAVGRGIATLWERWHRARRKGRGRGGEA